MAITNARLLVEPRYDGSPGIYVGVGAPGSEVYDKGTIYNRSDAVGTYVSDGAGGWTQLLDTASTVVPANAVNLATPVFSGTGQSSAGQVITTTDNQTMTLNQCAGMWFVSATHGPYLIASNTAVTGAPAVLTIYGGAPTTDAGSYKILKGPTPVITP